MRPVLYSEIAKERCNAKALGAVNIVLAYSAKYQGKTYTFKLERNQYGVASARRYADGEKTSFIQVLSRVADNIRSK